MGKNRHPVECSCRKAEWEQQETAIKERKHLDLVRRLKEDGFSDSVMQNWTFANDNGRSPQMHHAQRYVEQWRTMRSENIGLLLWGGVGTGKSFLAGCIANALMVQEVPVRMTNFARILNELNNSFSGRNEVVAGYAAILFSSLMILAWSVYGVCSGTNLQHCRQPLPQPEAFNRYHESDAGRNPASAGYRPCPYL